MKNEEIKQLLIDCANFIQPYDDGGNEAERLMIRLDKALEQGQTYPLGAVSECGECGRDLNKKGKCDSQLCKNYDWHW